jgi:hypothetical protein
MTIEPNLINRRCKFAHEHLFQTVHFSARIVKVEGDHAWVEIPARIRALPFPPLGGKRYGLFPISKLQLVEDKTH